VTFTVKSSEPVPFNRCYCTACRKTAGAGGFAINIGADFKTLKVEGREHIRVYHARIPDPETGEITVSKGERSFCELCGSALWAWDPDWPDLVHPHASAIDTDLPVPVLGRSLHRAVGSKIRRVSRPEPGGLASRKRIRLTVRLSVTGGRCAVLVPTARPSAAGGSNMRP
jgi:hypothetical protein